MEQHMSRFSRFATWVSHTSGHPSSFIFALVIIVVWAVTGPLFKFSDTWQLVINTGTTIVTFLIVFLIQNTQNRDPPSEQAGPSLGHCGGSGVHVTHPVLGPPRVGSTRRAGSRSVRGVVANGFASFVARS